ncbi:hypothetical protein B7486_49280 [cyanobacterium TDX16]|nr:hypothetical protein B7486_49280 [cyanobacterium TDX16]
MTNFKGNPDFGTKYRAPKKADEELSEQVNARIATQTKLNLKKVAKSKNCTVPDLVRDAIEQYLANLQAENAT